MATGGFRTAEIGPANYAGLINNVTKGIKKGGQFGKKKEATRTKTTTTTWDIKGGSPAAAEEKSKVAAKPKKGRDATTKDVETAVSKGFITPEEATGGEWGKSSALSSTYSKKSAANAAAHGGTNVGKQFTGVRASKNSVGAKPTFDVAPNFSSAPADSRPKTGDIVDTPHGKAVKLD
jgi:hypothetical protein